jgi:predicted NUDIX family phosphoesterase
MNQVVKDKMAREIMVVSNDKLFQNTERKNGFYKENEADFEKQILDNYEFMVRKDAEVNFDYKQPIPYAVVMDENGYVFVYKR